jgi:2-polyprenyl-3-methyl-5-hydroxy-6-metoxy-1,4-benzoquinol methylase
MATINPADAYSDKDSSYSNADRQHVFQLIPSGNPGRILDIGAAEGSMLVALKRSGKAGEVVGVELMDISGGGQSRRKIDQFIIADVEQRSLDLEPESFDVMICGDVLEHLRDLGTPLSTLPAFCGAAAP